MNAPLLRPAAWLLVLACATAAAQPARRNATPPPPAASAASQPAAARLLDLNAASVGELAKLPRMDERLARKVVENRDYRDVRELLERNILPNSVYQAMKGRVEVKKP